MFFMTILHPWTKISFLCMHWISCWLLVVVILESSTDHLPFCFPWHDLLHLSCNVPHFGFLWLSWLWLSKRKVNVLMSHIFSFPDYFIVVFLAYFFILDISSKLEVKYKSLIWFYIMFCRYTSWVIDNVSFMLHHIKRHLSDCPSINDSKPHLLVKVCVSLCL